MLVDAGPLVALLDRSDPHHQDCSRVVRGLAQPMLTVWPAFTEAMYLLGFSWKAQSALWELVEQGAVDFAALDATDAPRVHALMRKYRDLPMDLADAALVRVAERDRIHQIFTVDRRDFTIYRPAGLGRFVIVP